MTEEYLTIEECSSLLKVSDRTIRRWIEKGIIPALKVEKTVRILKSELDRLGKTFPSQKEKNSEEFEEGKFSNLSEKTFNRIWDNDTDAEIWDNWRPPNAKS